MKRIICILLSVCTLMMCLSVIAYADTETTFNQNNVDEKSIELFDEYTAFYKSLGILGKKDSVAYSDQITRGMFSSMVAKMLGINATDEDVQYVTNVFTDVSSNHMYAKEILALYNAGIVTGGGSTFEPDAYITYTDALHILLKVMGYGEFIKVNGGYYEGDYLVARKIRMDVYNYDDNSALNLFSLLYEALKTNMLDISIISGNEIYYDNSESKTLADNFFGLKNDKGILESNGFASINPNLTSRKDRVVIDGREYITSTTFDIYAGTKVEYFYSDYNGVYEVKFMIVHSDNNYLIVDADDINIFEGMTYKYNDKNDKEKKVVLPSDVTVLYNGELLTSLDYDKMVPDDGYIVYIDNNQDKKYEVVNIMSYVSFVIKEITKDNASVILYPDNNLNILPVKIDLNDDVKYLLTKDGKNFSVNSIKTGTVITAYTTYENEQYQKLRIGRISEAKVFGDVAINNSYDLIYIINGVEYKVTGTFEKYEHPNIDPKGKVTFYLNDEGKIVALCTELQGDMGYGYVYDIALKKGSFKNYLQLKMYSELGRVIVYDVAEKVTVDEVHYTDNSMDVVKSKLVDGENKVVPQVIRYDINKDREIIKIDFPKDINDGTESVSKIDDRLFRFIPTKDGQVGGVANQLYYRYLSKAFSNRIKIDDNTLIFKVPTNADNTYDMKNAVESDFQILTIADLRAYGNANYYVESYTLDPDSLVSNVVVIKNYYSQIAETVLPSLVKRIYSTVNEDGEQTYSLLLEDSDGEKEYTLREKSVLDKAKMSVSGDIYKISEGDVIRFSIDAKNQIDNAFIDYKYDKDISARAPNISYTLLAPRITNMYAYSIDGTNVLLSYTNPEITEFSRMFSEMFDFTAFKAIYARKKGNTLEFSNASITDLNTYMYTGKADECAVITSNGEPKMLVIYER